MHLIFNRENIINLEYYATLKNQQIINAQLIHFLLAME